jgi:hypothetical protein
LNQPIKVLVEQSAAGTLDLSYQKMDKELKRLKEFIVHVQGNLVILWSQMNQVAGE